jgi:hypothetical protein
MVVLCEPQSKSQTSDVDHPRVAQRRGTCPPESPKTVALRELAKLTYFISFL